VAFRRVHCLARGAISLRASACSDWFCQAFKDIVSSELTICYGGDNLLVSFHAISGLEVLTILPPSIVAWIAAQLHGHILVPIMGHAPGPSELVIWP